VTQDVEFAVRASDCIDARPARRWLEHLIAEVVGIELAPEAVAPDQVIVV
jgi:hypothetical protein